MTGPVAERPRLGTGARGLVVACAIGAGVSWNIANVGPIASTIADHYGIALASVGLFTTVLFLAELLAMGPAGRLIDRYGARRVAAVALPAILAANALTLVVDHVVAALALRAVVGAGVGFGFLAGAAHVQETGGGAFGQGLYGGLTLGVGGLAVAVVPALEPQLGWQAPFVSATVASALALAVLAVVREPRTARAPRPRSSLLRLVADRRLLRFAAMMAASFGVGIVLSNWAVEIVERRGGLGPETAGLVGSLILLLGVFGRPAGGLIAQRRPDRVRTLLAGAMLLGAAGTLLLGLARPTPVAVLGALMVGVAAGLPFGPALAGLARAFPDQPAAAIGAANACSMVVIIVGTPLVGTTFGMPGDGLIGFAAVAALWAATVLAVPREDGG